MTLIDGDKIVTAQLYDDEHEEFTEKKMSIIDYVNTYTDEGVTTADDILGRIRDEIEQKARPNEIGGRGNGKSIRYGLCMALEIIDKHMAEGSEA